MMNYPFNMTSKKQLSFFADVTEATGSF